MIKIAEKLTTFMLKKIQKSKYFNTWKSQPQSLNHISLTSREQSINQHLSRMELSVAKAKQDISSFKTYEQSD